MKHTHFASATNTIGTFLGVALVGTLWRLSALHATASSRPFLQRVGRMMLLQY